MWAAIKAALRALNDFMRSTTSGFANALWWLDERATNIWNGWARMVSGTVYRPAPVYDLRDQVENVVAPDPTPAAPVPCLHDDLGRRVKAAASAIIAGAKDVPDDLPADVGLWLLAREKTDLLVVVRATDDMVGRHMTGQPCLKGPNGSLLLLPHAGRDTAILSQAAEREAHRRAQIRELFSNPCPPLPDEPEEEEEEVVDPVRKPSLPRPH